MATVSRTWADLLHCWRRSPSCALHNTWVCSMCRHGRGPDISARSGAAAVRCTSAAAAAAT